MADQRHLDVLGDRHRREGLGDLEGAPDAAPEFFARRQARHVRAVEDDRAGVGPKLPADHVEGRGLAGAVRADEGEELAGLDVEAHVARRHDAAEALAQALHG